MAHIWGEKQGHCIVRARDSTASYLPRPGSQLGSCLLFRRHSVYPLGEFPGPSVGSATQTMSLFCTCHEAGSAIPRANATRVVSVHYSVHEK